MSIKVTEHAKKRLRQRGLRWRQLKHALEHGVRMPTLGGATYVAGKGIRLILDDDVVVTAYKPPKKK